jgi:hypothetical protein
VLLVYYDSLKSSPSHRVAWWAPWRRSGKDKVRPRGNVTPLLAATRSLKERHPHFLTLNKFPFTLVSSRLLELRRNLINLHRCHLTDCETLHLAPPRLGKKRGIACSYYRIPPCVLSSRTPSIQYFEPAMACDATISPHS